MGRLHADVLVSSETTDVKCGNCEVSLDPPAPEVANIRFSAEACETAHTMYLNMVGYHVAAKLPDGTTGDYRIHSVRLSEPDGFTLVVLEPTDMETGDPTGEPSVAIHVYNPALELTVY